MCVKFIEDLVKHFADIGSWGIETIVAANEVTGERYECEVFGHRYVHQKGSGQTGDDFWGCEFVPLDGKYVKIWYCC